MRATILLFVFSSLSAFAQNPCLLLSSPVTSAPVAGGTVPVVLNSLTGLTCSFDPPSADVPWITAIASVPPVPDSAGSLNLTVEPNPTGIPRSGHVTFPGQAISLTVTQQGTGALRFIPMVPCRIADTRVAGGALSGNKSRDFVIASPACPLVTGAQAFALNVTAIPKGPLSFLTVWPTGQDRPFVSTLNSASGTTVANGAIVPSGANRSISVFSTDATDIVIDVEGFFVPASFPAGLSFYPVPPCRVLDSRPDQTLANNAIIAAAGNGSITMYGSQATDLIVDVNGYFADPGGAGALDFYTLAPCRIADTRLTFWLPPPSASRDFDVAGASCGVPTAARAYAMNITAVPVGPLSFLTAFPAGGARPFVSTLNAGDGRVTANGALLPSSASGSISVFASSSKGTHVVIDINGYFAP